jgi:hypothetical protein|tara:strand:+ start:1622 stop:2095 length:474 start_codon:yes stop_codon:yes gene_type:complete
MFSICIPQIDTQHDEQYIHRTLSFHKIGEIFQIDLVKNTKSNTNKAFVHFSRLYNNEKSNQVLNILVDKKEDIKIFHNFPDFWVCKLNKSKHKMQKNKRYNYAKKIRKNNSYKEKEIKKVYNARQKNNSNLKPKKMYRKSYYNSYRNNYQKRDYYGE